MIESRRSQLIYEIIFLAIGILTIVFSFYDYIPKSGWGYVDYFYVMFSNLAVYFVFVLMVIVFIKTIIAYIKKENDPVTFVKHLTFYAIVYVVLYFLIDWIVLAFMLGDGELKISELGIGNLTFKMILFPILYFVFWIIYYTHGEIRWYDCFLALIIPIIFVILSFVRETVVLNYYGGYPNGSELQYSIGWLYDIYYYGLGFELLFIIIGCLIQYILSLILQTIDKAIGRHLQ